MQEQSKAFQSMEKQIPKLFEFGAQFVASSWKSLLRREWSTQDAAHQRDVPGMAKALRNDWYHCRANEASDPSEVVVA
jgi:hypothetical protein